jgi:sodium/proline symporter
MSGDWLTIGVIVLYAIGLLAIGSWASKKVHSSEDYILAGRSLGFWVFTILMVASVCSGMTLVGVSGFGFTSGWPGFWEELAVPLAAAFAIIVFGVKLHYIGKRSGYMTVEDYFAQRFESPKAVRGVSAVAGIIVSLIYLVGQYTAISIVLVWLFGIDHVIALLIAAFIITVYTVIGGMYAVSWTTLIQGGILIIGVLIMAPLVIISAGGLEHINTVLSSIDPNLIQPYFPSAYASYAYCTPEYLVGFVIMLTIGLACAPHVVNNVLAAKEEKFFKWSPLVAFVLYLVVISLVKISGFAVRVLVEEGKLVLPATVNAQDFAFMYGVEFASPNMLIWALFAVIVLSAVMSTTDRLMLTIGTMFSWDIYKNLLKPDASDRQVLRLSQVCVFIAAAISLILAINPPEMLAFLIWMGIGVMLSTFAVPFIAGLYWRRATTQGALAAMLVGLIGSGIFAYWNQYVAKLPMHYSIYSLSCAAIAMIAVSLLTPKNSEEVLDLTMTGPFIKPRD